MSEKKDRDESGKFVKGHKVPSPRTGRKRKDDYPLLKAITEGAYSPEEMVGMIWETYELAKEEKDWKGMFQVIQSITYYSIGKPVQRTLTASVNATDLRALFGPTEQETPRGETDEVIDGEVRVVE